MKYRAYKYRLYPNNEQKVLIEKHIGSCRFIYNYALAKKVKAYQIDRINLSRFDIQSDLPKMKRSEEYCWLKEVNSSSLQASLANLDSAYTKFFREHRRFPKFKSKKDNKQSFSVPKNTKVNFENNYVFIPKFKSGIKAKIHRTFEGIVKSSTISRTATGKYFISILVEMNEHNTPMRPICENKTVGIDLGIKTFAVISDGTEIPNPKYLNKSLDKIKKLQRSLSRKAKGSKNREKSRIKLALAHEKVVNRRNNFLHKVTYYLVNNYDTICLEDLNVKGMVKNHHLAQSLLDISIGAFNTILEYKAKERGINILRIGRFEPSSRLCTCGYINRSLTLNIREWVCPECGSIHDRDLLAANNIKLFALRNINTVGTTEINACGDMSGVTHLAQETPNI